MRIGVFDILEPIPEFKNLHAITILHPWVDAGNVGAMALGQLESHFGAKEFGKLHRPGNFFDFTRYRPTSRFVEDRREIVIPNTNIYYSLGTDGPDFLFIHLMEPHAFAERYIESVVDLLKTFNVKRYCRISGMYNAVPHTRPLRVTSSSELSKMPGMSGLITPRQANGGYQGPTSIMHSLTDELEKFGTEMINFMVHLPHYLSLENDFAGTARLMQVICALYDLPADLADMNRGAEQYQEIGSQVGSNPQVKALIAQLEEYYDEEHSSEPVQDDLLLAPDVESFLREVGQRLDDNK